MKMRQGVAREAALGHAGQGVRSGEHGFTLLEMTIVLVIIGLIVGMMAPLLGRVLDSTQETATINRMDQIEEAVVLFLRRNGRLPCPAAPDGTPLGEERATCNGANANGIVPFRTLGLSDEIARDGFSRYITFHIEPVFAAGSLLLPIDTGFCTESEPALTRLTITDENNDPVVDHDDNPIALVLVSHGENSFGHYLAPTAARFNAAGGGDFEDDNANGDRSFRDSALFDDDVPNGPYDDIIRWYTRDGLGAQVQEFGCP